MIFYIGEGRERRVSHKCSVVSKSRSRHFQKAQLRRVSHCPKREGGFGVSECHAHMWSLCSQLVEFLAQNVPPPINPWKPKESPQSRLKQFDPIHKFTEANQHLLWWLWPHGWHLCVFRIFHTKFQPFTCPNVTCIYLLVAFAIYDSNETLIFVRLQGSTPRNLMVIKGKGELSTTVVGIVVLHDVLTLRTNWGELQLLVPSSIRGLRIGWTMPLMPPSLYLRDITLEAELQVLHLGVLGVVSFPLCNICASTWGVNYNYFTKEGIFVFVFEV